MESISPRVIQKCKQLLTKLHQGICSRWEGSLLVLGSNLTLTVDKWILPKQLFRRKMHTAQHGSLCAPPPQDLRLTSSEVTPRTFLFVPSCKCYIVTQPRNLDSSITSLIFKCDIHSDSILLLSYLFHSVLSYMIVISLIKMLTLPV